MVRTSSKKLRLENYLASAELPDLTPEDVKAIDDAGMKLHFRGYVSMVLLLRNHALRRFIPLTHCLAPFRCTIWTSLVLETIGLPYISCRMCIAELIAGIINSETILNTIGDSFLEKFASILVSNLSHPRH